MTFKKRSKAIYMDYQATTPLDPAVLEVMMPYFTEKFGNPHSTTHAYGWEAEAGVERARRQIAALINAEIDDIIFTSGATEANNLAIKGVMQSYGDKRPHVVSVVTEHKCVSNTIKATEIYGCKSTFVPVGTNGLVDLADIEAAITDQTALVSVMAVNNEIGVIQPIKEIAKLAHAKGALFHTDAAQAFGKIPIDVIEDGIDLLSISGHKIYGPKGVGALYINSKKRIKLTPHMSGGSQEKGIRAGTLAPALCAGLGMAAQIASENMGQEASRITTLMERFKTKLFSAHKGIIINGDIQQRWAGNLNMSFPGLDGTLLLANLRGVAVSSGAACASAVKEPSYIQKAIGNGIKLSKSSIRLGIGRFTTEDEIDQAADIFITVLDKMGGIKA